MGNVFDVQNGTYAKLGNEVGIVAAINNSNVNVTYYMSERDKYKAEFNQWSKKTAQASLEMGRVVYEAKKELESQDFLKFCNEIGRKGEDATVRKFLKIGEKYDNFYKYADLLPNSWTSIYEITQLPSDVFEALVATDNSMANMTGEQIKSLMGKKAEDKSTDTQTAQTAKVATDDVGVTVSLSATSDVVTATSDETMTDAIESVTDSVSVIADNPSNDVQSDSNREFAKHATDTMLERVTATASAYVDVQEPFEPYELVLRLNEKPSDDAVHALVEAIHQIKSKYRLNLEISQSNALCV